MYFPPGYSLVPFLPFAEFVHPPPGSINLTRWRLPRFLSECVKYDNAATGEHEVDQSMGLWAKLPQFPVQLSGIVISDTQVCRQVEMMPNGRSVCLALALNILTSWLPTPAICIELYNPTCRPLIHSHYSEIVIKIKRFQVDTKLLLQRDPSGNNPDSDDPCHARSSAA